MTGRSGPIDRTLKPSVQSLTERFQRRFSATGRVRSSLTGLSQRPVASGHAKNTDRTLGPDAQVLTGHWNPASGRFSRSVWSQTFQR